MYVYSVLIGGSREVKWFVQTNFIESIRNKTKQDVNSGSEVDHIVLKGTIRDRKTNQIIFVLSENPFNMILSC